MHVLITGGAGFIGSHLTDAFLTRGDRVTILDDLSTGNRDNLAAALRSPHTRFVQGRVEDPEVMDPLMRECDAVVHFAAVVGVDLVVRDPVRTIETNVHGTEQVLRLAVKHGRRVLLASSSEVYGRANSAAFNEADDLVIGPPTHFRWVYAASKALDEYLAFAFAKEYGLRATVVRFFNIVGPRQTGRYGMVLPRFAAQALAGTPVRVFGDGEQTRCFCHVQDAVDAVLRLLEREDSVNEIFNIGSPETISINCLAQRVIGLAGSASTIDHIPYDQAYAPGFDDMLRRVPDIGKIRALTGWQPRHTLDDIIRDVITTLRSGVAQA